MAEWRGRAQAQLESSRWQEVRGSAWGVACGGLARDMKALRDSAREAVDTDVRARLEAQAAEIETKLRSLLERAGSPVAARILAERLGQSAR